MTIRVVNIIKCNKGASVCSCVAEKEIEECVSYQTGISVLSHIECSSRACVRRSLASTRGIVVCGSVFSSIDDERCEKAMYLSLSPNNNTTQFSSEEECIISHACVCLSKQTIGHSLIGEQSGKAHPR